LIIFGTDVIDELLQKILLALILGMVIAYLHELHKTISHR
jgi:hypothetical protein